MCIYFETKIMYIINNKTFYEKLLFYVEYSSNHYNNIYNILIPLN